MLVIWAIVGLDDDHVRMMWLAKISGYAALGCLVISQWISPACGIMALARSPVDAALQYHLRRDFGIAAALLAVVHGSVMGLRSFSDGGWQLIVQKPWLQSGAVALLILLVLWATSYPRVVRLFRLKTWKSLHRLVFVAVGLALFHAISGPHAFVGLLFWLAVAVVLAWGVRVVLCIGFPGPDVRKQKI
ncbi:MAG: ferric reductase-like transmembrane domain-containing protein [Phycisphaeraceae bacterium]|nr:ferric reductase-like transmembrane domain-containing protein [Phycisphaeraceae bacterium]